MRAALLVVVALGGAAFGTYRAQSNCVLGVQGTRATLTLQGFGAKSRCKRFADRNHDFYVRKQAAVEPVICEGDKDGLHYAVRDEGLIVLIGRVTCARMSDKSLTL